MSFLDRFRSKPPGAWVTLRSLEAARKVPQLVDPGGRGRTREELARCDACGGVNRDVVLTSGGPLGDEQTWRRHPVAFDARQCKGCGNLAFPVALEQDEVQALLDAGAAAGQAGKLDEADLAFRRAANGAPDLGLPRLNLGSVCLDLARQAATGEEQGALGRAAVALFRQALTCPYPAPVGARFLLGRTLVLMGDIEEGQRELRAFLAGPTAPAAMRKEARALLDRRDWRLTEAQGRAFTEGDELIDIQRYLHDRTPKTEEDRSRLRRGMARLDALLAERPDHWPSLWISGMAACALRDWEDAHRRLGEAYRIYPEQPDVAREFGAACLALGQGEAAVAVARQAVANDPSDVGLQANLALALLVAGDVGKAEETAAEALARAPEDAVTRNLVGFIRKVKAGSAKRPTWWRPPDR